MAGLFDTLGKTVGKVVGEISEMFDHNRRHDDPNEKLNDAIRAEINAGHRFESFSDMRSGNMVKWHVDGHDFFWAVSEFIDSAREAIFIMDWWLSPELYLRRPPASFPEWRLDRLLAKKARQGVKIHIIVYKEVQATMSMNSQHTKDALQALHPNIAVMRHPDHIGSADTTEFWSHHEKVVVVDNHFATIGGLDLCYGRWDTNTHPLADAHPTDFARTLFPGQDYNNGRVLDFQKVDNYVSNALSILETPRMPWHDVHMTIVGPSVLDIVQHFTERWNEVKKRKYADDNRYELLALPHNIEVAPNEPVARHPHREQWSRMGRQYQQRYFPAYGGGGSGGGEEQQQQPDEPVDYSDGRTPRRSGNCNVQVCRSVSDWSHGVLKEHSIQNAYIQLINEAKHFIYIENQFFISNTGDKGPVTNRIAGALADRIITAGRNRERFKIIVVIPAVPGFSGDIKEQSAIKTIMAAQWRTINRGGASIYEVVRNAGVEPLDYIRFYHLRSYDRINAPTSSFIQKMEQNSGVSFHQAQVALAKQWVGNAQGTVQEDVTIKVPEATSEGLVETQKGKEEAIKLPATEEDAREIVARFERGAKGERSDERVSDSIAQHALEDRTPLKSEQWLGTAEEERNAYVTELLYIHSKLMIVDDLRVIMGSANLNDRSQKGNGDSEIALVVEDNDLIPASFNGQQVMVSRFASSLRRKLFREHLGLIEPQLPAPHQHATPFMRPAPHPNPDETHLNEDRLVADPLCDQFARLWEGTAENNTRIFDEVFRPVPTDLVKNWDDYTAYVPKVKAGHLPADVSLDHAKDSLSQVKGHLVKAPINFLIDVPDLVEGPEWHVAVNPTLPIYI